MTGDKWIFAMPNLSLQPVLAGWQSIGVLVDSGAVIHACPKWFGNAMLCGQSPVIVKTASGQIVKHWGQHVVSLQLGARDYDFTFEVAKVRHPIFSVMRLLQDSQDPGNPSWRRQQVITLR